MPQQANDGTTKAESVRAPSRLLRNVNLLLFVDAPCEKDNSADDGYDRAYACQNGIGGAALRSGSSEKHHELVDGKDGCGQTYNKAKNVFQATHIEPPAFASEIENDDA